MADTPGEPDYCDVVGCYDPVAWTLKDTQGEVFQFCDEHYRVICQAVPPP